MKKNTSLPGAFSRRAFLFNTAAAIGTRIIARVGAVPAWARPIGANDAVGVAVIGLNNKGADHVKQLAGMPGVRSSLSATLIRRFSPAR